MEQLSLSRHIACEFPLTCWSRLWYGHVMRKSVTMVLSRRAMLSTLLLTAAGCQCVAPVHVWTPAKMQSAVGCRVAIAPLTGDKSLAEPLRLAMLTQPPRDPGRAIQCIDSGQLPHTNQAVRLVSASSSETSDLFHMNLVKQQNVDFLLTGEVIEQPSEQRSRLHRQSQYGDELVPLEPLDPTASAASAVPTVRRGTPRRLRQPNPRLFK